MQTMVQEQNNLISQLQTALAHQAKNNYAEAESIFKSALKQNPNHPDILYMLGLLYFQWEKYDLSANTLKKAPQKTPHYDKFLKMIIRCYLEQDKSMQARPFIEKLVKIAPNDTDTLGLSGLYYYKNAQFEEAANYLYASVKNAVKPEYLLRLAEVLNIRQKPDTSISILEKYKGTDAADHNVLHFLGKMYMQEHRYDEAYTVLANIFEKHPENKEIIDTLSFYYRTNIRRFLSARDTQILYRCLCHPETYYKNFEGICRQFYHDALAQKGFKDILKLETYDEFIHHVTRDDLIAFVTDPLLLEMLAKSLLIEKQLELLFTFLRRFLLQTYSENPQKLSDYEALLLGIACQCDLNEQVYYISEKEYPQIESLRNDLRDNQNTLNDKDRALRLALLCCYEQVHSHGFVDGIKYDNGFFQYLYKRSVSDWREINEIKKHIKSFNPIKNEVSSKVREQYEENPYPRWINASPVSISSTKYVEKKRQSKTNALIAGCGTGQQVMYAVRRMPNAKITAIDLSTASLSYAIFKGQQYGIENVDFYQCDILDVGSLAKKIGRQQFDVIECTGVLHHMQDPMQGWRELNKLLKPGGIMRIGLYSDLARSSVVAARGFIAQNGYKDSADSIRQCRWDIYALPNDNLAHKVRTLNDFFSLSTCRDLIFHVQEHRFTIPRIQDCLNELGLTFDKFHFTVPEHENKFIKMFGENADKSDLGLWHKFETEHPNTFIGMYQFSVRKTA